jgi:hypothetical protein
MYLLDIARPHRRAANLIVDISTVGKESQMSEKRRRRGMGDGRGRVQAQECLGIGEEL